MVTEMSWTNRMARHGSERSLNGLQSMHPGQSSRVVGSVVEGSPMSPTTPTTPTTTMTLTATLTTGGYSTTTTTTTTPSKVSFKVNDDNEEIGKGVDRTMIAITTATTTPTSSLLSSSSSWDSRIPRPSPTSLRRSLSMRVRGERLPPLITSPRATAATTSPATVVGYQHHHYRRNNHHPLQQQQHHQHPNHRTFPVITENGTDSPRQRSFSLSLTPARPRSGHAASGTNTATDESDAESVKSYGSACSTASACDHASFALNGTTWSGRSRKYVVHCSNHNGDNEQYLTPTQRAARQVRKFQALLKEARKEIEEKDREIFRLTKEVVELRLYKASLNSPDERTDSSDALTVRENNPFSPESPCKDLPDEGSFEKATSPETPEKPTQSDIPSSLADSGHFEDGSVHSKDSVCLPETVPEPSNNVPSNNAPKDNSRSISVAESSERDEERRILVDHYESRIEEIHRRHIDELQELKQKHNDKVESLLNQLSEVNTRYCEVRPSVDAAEARARELETELEAVKMEFTEQKTLLNEQEERNKQMYLKMYAKGQEAARLEHVDQLQIVGQSNQIQPKVTVAELLQQLTVTQAELENIKDTSYSPEPHISADRSQNLLSAQEAVSLWVLGTRKAMYRRIVEARSSQGVLDPEITLQFLKSAIYYFLTDKENHHGHLNAIESILGFTDAEKHNIDKIYGSARK